MTDHDERANPADDEPAGPEAADTAASGADPDETPRPHDAEQASAAAGPAESGGKTPGTVRYQDPATTVAREPTLAEKRAREVAIRKQREASEAAVEAELRKRKKRKRILIGAGVTVGVVAVVAIGYAVSQPDEVTASCVDANDTIVDDSNCITPAASNNGYSSHGGGFYPIFIGGGGGQYHYNYGGTGEIGQRASGGSTAAPRDANVRTRSGSTVQRGGFGVSKGSSGGSSSGGSSGGS